MRTATINRKTNETNIDLEFNLDGSGKYQIDTKIPFFNHMLEQFTKHGSFDLKIKLDGDMDSHHIVEDLGICLGEAIKKTVGDKKGIKRYGTAKIPMDDALAEVIIDICNRAYLYQNLNFNVEKCDDLDLEVFPEFFRAVATEAKITIHISQIRGNNAHHIIESIFKAFGAALDDACLIVGDEVRSTKGVL